MANSYTDIERQMALDIYHAQGATAASRQIGCSRQTIYDWLADELSTDNNMAKEKAERRVYMREVMRHRLLTTALRLVDRVHEPWTYIDKEGVSHEVSEPPGREARELMVAAGIAIDKFRLEIGEATGRTEQIPTATIEAEIERLESRLAVNDPADADH